MTDPFSSTPVKSALRTLDIIEYVVSRGRPPVAQEIAAALSIPVSSLSYLLSTLVDRGYLERVGRRYTPGPSLVRLSDQGGAFTLADKVAPLVKTLRIQLNETVSFFVRKEWVLEALVTETSDHALRYAVQVGIHAPIHAMSAGKALLAELDDGELKRYFAAAELSAMTGKTITDEATLRAQIEEVRRTGIARACEEFTPGIAALGRAVKIDGDVVGAFSVAIPLVRFDAIEHRASELLKRTADLLSD